MKTKKIQLTLLAFAILPSMIISQKNESYYLLAGTYTSGSSEGIYVYKFNPVENSVAEVSTIKTSNPSYLAVSPDEKFVYSVNQDIPGTLSSFSFDKKTGILTFLNKESSLGIRPCYITTDKSGEWVIAANYNSGTISIHGIDKEGKLKHSGDSVQHFGSSVVTGRQEGPHVHSVNFSIDNKFLYAPDLGADRVMIYRFKKESGSLSPAGIPFVITEPGAGPRHMAFHPSDKYAYVIEELSGSVSAYFINKDGSLALIQNISCQPREYLGPVSSADIHVSPDGNFLYCSNRGESNTIAIFSINKTSGLLTWVGSHETMGKTPRNFNFDPTGNYLFVANQDSNDIVIFRVNKKTGLLTDTGKRINIPNPVCIKWIQAD